MIDKLTARLLKWLESNGRKRIISDRESPDEPYLERYFLLFPPGKRPSWFPFNVLLHHFCRSDKDSFHDHPWNWMSIVLKGGYFEYRPTYSASGDRVGLSANWRKPGSVAIRKATDLHYVILNPKLANNQEVWTLFFIGHRFREWGFIDPETGEWMQWEQYCNKKAIAIPEWQQKGEKS